MKKSELTLLRRNMTKALEPPKPKPKTPDISDELSKLYDDGTVLESEKTGALSASKSSQSRGGSQPEIAPPARQNDSQPKYDSQPDSDSLPANLFASLPHAAGFLRLPNTITDNLLRLLSADAQVVYVQLYRLSHGNGKPTCWISLPKLAERTNIKMTSLKAAVKQLETRGLIVKSNLNLGYGKQQGIEYRVAAPDRQSDSDRQSRGDSQPESDHIKEKHILKENTQTQEASATGVSVGSKFSLEECQRYAAHLKSTGQGITNPGGYATKIYRSGEADALVEKFLNPDPMIDVSMCPDCEGKGYYFPDPSKPETVRCKHDLLRA
jgi:biotin operon repressor